MFINTATGAAVSELAVDQDGWNRANAKRFGTFGNIDVLHIEDG
jgi:hypothetical protein